MAAYRSSRNEQEEQGGEGLFVGMPIFGYTESMLNDRCHGRAGRTHSQRLVWLSLWFGAVALAAACGGTTVIENGNGSSGSAGSGTTTTASGMTSSSSGTTGCTLGSCADGFYCATYPNSCDSQGSCQPAVDLCDDDCPGICGCDGEFYCNECTAQAAGVDVTPDKKGCLPANVEYDAQAWFGAFDHIIISRADYTNDTCIVLSLAAPYMSEPAYALTMPQSWGVSYLSASASAIDCFEGGSTSMVIAADGAVGSVDWKVEPNMYFPCEVSVAATISFSAPFPGLGVTESFEVTSLIVEGACF